MNDGRHIHLTSPKNDEKRVLDCTDSHHLSLPIIQIVIHRLATDCFSIIRIVQTFNFSCEVIQIFLTDLNVHCNLFVPFGMICSIFCTRFNLENKQIKQ
ncbi:unnamed protein product [Schistosoma mattheei]|uniref:Uncharacterized protein n=1 Tax=Schistosoma mattheei TaxID=31246 RepID=A0A183PL01_9TREM|nr:unnamed protein product [Schistosoma mattheei]